MGGRLCHSYAAGIMALSRLYDLPATLSASFRAPPTVARPGPSRTRDMITILTTAHALDRTMRRTHPARASERATPHSGWKQKLAAILAFLAAISALFVLLVLAMAAKFLVFAWFHGHEAAATEMARLFWRLLSP